MQPRPTTVKSVLVEWLYWIIVGGQVLVGTICLGLYAYFTKHENKAKADISLQVFLALSIGTAAAFLAGVQEWRKEERKKQKATIALMLQQSPNPPPPPPKLQQLNNVVQELRNVVRELGTLRGEVQSLRQTLVAQPQQQQQQQQQQPPPKPPAAQANLPQGAA